MTAKERLQALAQVQDLLQQARGRMVSISDPPNMQFRDVVLDAHDQVIGAVDQWQQFERDKLA